MCIARCRMSFVARRSSRGRTGLGVLMGRWVDWRGGARTIEENAEAALGEEGSDVFPDDGGHGEAVNEDDLDAHHALREPRIAAHSPARPSPGQ